MREKLPSPCISICQMDPIRQVCLGCYRTRQEIARWPALNGDEQHQILELLKMRKQEHTGIKRVRSSRRS